METQYPKYTEEQLESEMVRLNDEYLDDERTNLDLELGRGIVCLGDIGRWNGREQHYGTLQSTNLKETLNIQSEYAEWAEWYVEDGEYRCDVYHHDGVNHYVFRVLKPGVGSDDIGYFEDPEEAKKVIMANTESLAPIVSNVYGWEVDA